VPTPWRACETDELPTDQFRRATGWAEHWPVFFGKFTEMMQREPHIPVDDLIRISAPTLVVMGDDDLMSIEHSAALFRAIPNSELAVIPGASHTLPMEKPELLNRIVLDFLENEPVPTMMPVRRAAAH
jgi:pimeloyl-ACP methyl ester carboxylesterase